MGHFDDEQIKNLTDKARMGWWEADFTKQQYICSDFLCYLLDLGEKNTISFEDFRKLIQEEYRQRTVKEFYFGKTQNSYDQIYPLKTIEGILWVRVKLCSKENDAQGNLKTYGFMECLDTPEQYDSTELAMKRINNLFSQQYSISHSLFSLFQAKDVSTVINKILGDILIQYPKGRIYIVEYDQENNTHSCRYQASNKDFISEITNAVNIPAKSISWLHEQLIEKKSPIIAANLDELPPEADYIKKYLKGQGIYATLIIPMFSRDGIYGYAGFDIAEPNHVWENEDYQWFSSLINVISVCIEFRKSQEQISTEKQYLSNLYKYMPIGYIRLKILFDETGEAINYTILDANKACYDIYKVDFSKVDELYRETWVHHADQIARIRQLLQNGKPVERDYYLEKQNKYCHSLHYSPQKDEVVVLITDITETYLAHEALDHSERILRNIYQNLPVGIELYDENGILVDINDKEEEIFGLENKKEILGLNIFDNPLVPEEAKEKIRKKENTDFLTNYDFSKLNGYYRTNKTQVINLQSKLTALYDSQDNFINYLLISIDQTEMTAANNKIREFNNFFTLVGDYAQVGYAHFNALTRDGYAISSWYRNVGEADGTPLTQIIAVHAHFHPDDRAVMLDFLDRVIRGETSHLRKDMRIMRENGQMTWTRVNVLVRDYRPQDGVIEMLCINYDITELKDIELKLIKAKEKAEASDHLKSAFLANMSHEIRTPLNAIVGFSSLLAETTDPKEQKQYLEIVEKNNELLLQLISDILDLSKIESGTFEMVFGEVDINRICMDIVKILQYKNPPGVELRFTPLLPECLINGDKNRIQQVITNFVNNAQKFTSSGSITLGYLVREREIEIYVSDTGIGIPPEKQNEIFQRFIKLNTFVNGTGLGLSICKSIVEQSGGRIGVQSSPGEGSRFWFTLPFYQEDRTKL